MIPKYQAMMDSVNSYIYNRIFVEKDDMIITKEVCKRFPTYVCWYKCNDTEMIEELIYQIVRMMRHTYNVAYTNALSITKTNEVQDGPESESTDH